ncbi:MAG: hypothetical protein H6Q26_1375, partial [Bacteroidetes bacterium]|nr:hypothetical protein [Bacteroidota bacterium]
TGEGSNVHEEVIYFREIEKAVSIEAAFLF